MAQGGKEHGGRSLVSLTLGRSLGDQRLITVGVKPRRTTGGGKKSDDESIRTTTNSEPAVDTGPDTVVQSEPLPGEKWDETGEGEGPHIHLHQPPESPTGVT